MSCVVIQKECTISVILATKRCATVYKLQKNIDDFLLSVLLIN
jgi:hypothetical protein